MTVKAEKVQSIKNAREFLQSLMDRSKTKRIPSDIRRQAYWCLRHFPFDFDIAIRPDFPSKAEQKAFKLLTIGQHEDIDQE